MDSILNVNAQIKYIEFLLHAFDEYPEETTLKNFEKSLKKNSKQT